MMMMLFVVIRFGGFCVGVQCFGIFFLGMIMFNIVVFIVWGFIMMFFILVGFFGVDSLFGWYWVGVVEIIGGGGDFVVIGWQGVMIVVVEGVDGNIFVYVGFVGLMVIYLLLLFIVNIVGCMVYGECGGVVVMIVIVGVIVGINILMFLGVMIMGLIVVWIIKQMDCLWDGKIWFGFEMLVNNFFVGIFGMIFVIVGFFVFGLVMFGISVVFGVVVDWFVLFNLLLFVLIIVELVKVLFLNNVINYGVFILFGIEQVVEIGKLILFFIEVNFGLGFGLLFVFMFFGVGVVKVLVFGVVIIQFFGGIYEIYFLYVLSKLIMIFVFIVGGVVGVIMNMVFGGGLVFLVVFGSIIVVIVVVVGFGVVNLLVVYFFVIIVVIVMFFIIGVILCVFCKCDLVVEGDVFGVVIVQIEVNKGKLFVVMDVFCILIGVLVFEVVVVLIMMMIVVVLIEIIVFVCDVGMGFFVMGVSVLCNKLKKVGIEDIIVINQVIVNFDGSVDVVIIQQQFIECVIVKLLNLVYVLVDNFMNFLKYEEVVEMVCVQ